MAVNTKHSRHKKSNVTHRKKAPSSIRLSHPIFGYSKTERKEEKRIERDIDSTMNKACFLPPVPSSMVRISHFSPTSSFRSISLESGRDRILYRSSIMNLQSSPTDVLSTEDIVVGAVLAVVLAFCGSFLQGRRAQNDFVLWEKAPKEMDSSNVTQTDRVVFDADSWKEMSRPDNYMLYNKNKLEEKKSASDSFRVEQAWVVIALLALFVPLFSVEFFFGLSRQFICGGDPLSQSDLAFELCSPHS
jgi:hypothetical protein